MTATTKVGRRRAARLSLEWAGVLEWRRSMFERKFGRPPLPGEPLFFDPAAQVPTRLAPEARRQALNEMLELVGG